MADTNSSNLERLVRVETKIEALSEDIADLKDGIRRIEDSLKKQIDNQQKQVDKQGERQWEMWAKIAMVSAGISLLITIMITKVL